MMATAYSNSLSDIDPRLLTEAFHRARESMPVSEVDSDSILSAIIVEARKGTRDMYGLVRAAQTQSPISAA